MTVKHQLVLGEGIDGIPSYDFSLHVDESRVLIQFGEVTECPRRVRVRNVVQVFSTETFNLLHTIDIGQFKVDKPWNSSWCSNGIFMVNGGGGDLKYNYFFKDYKQAILNLK